MPVTDTTNLGGSVGTNSSNATVVTIAAASAVTITIGGTGNARVCWNDSTPNATTDSVIPAGFPMLFLSPLAPVITKITLYADNGETLTYGISRNRGGF